MRCLLLVAALATPLFAESLSKGERDQAMSHLHATRKQMLDLIEPLSDAQWKFKPGPDRWSIAECAEHISETEAMLRGLVQKTAQTAQVDDAKRAERAGKKEANSKAMMTMMTDRSQKASAPAEVRPTGRFATKSALVAAFKERRDETIRYVETTQDDLRGRFFKLGPSETDLYDLLLIISGHTERHMLQMKEVQAAAGYPGR